MRHFLKKIKQYGGQQGQQVATNDPKISSLH